MSRILQLQFEKRTKNYMEDIIYFVISSANEKLAYNMLCVRYDHLQKFHNTKTTDHQECDVCASLTFLQVLPYTVFSAQATHRPMNRKQQQLLIDLLHFSWMLLLRAVIIAILVNWTSHPD